MTDLNLVTYFIGIEVAYCTKEYTLFQTKLAFETPKVIGIKMKVKR